ncbi:kinase-like domain-containing protein [Rhizophagus irregularis DAOM 181602=DAOM 197198]|nr:kinase-like domain-containing protein [Rhizophagus irregularis DAOM 181602=DAOM 197198]
MSRNTNMEILNKTSKEKPRNLWKDFDWKKYQSHVTVSSINFATKSEEIDDSVIYMDDIEKRKEVYAEWSGGYIGYWDIENQKWIRRTNYKAALKSLDNSSDISINFLNEITSYLQIYIWVNSDDVSTNLISECFDVQLSESDLNEINQEEEI